MNTDDKALPELTDARIDELETQLFAAIRAEGTGEPRRTAADERRRGVRRGRLWLAGGAAAAVIVVAAVIAPNLGGLGLNVGTSGAQTDSAAAPEMAPNAAQDSGGDMGGVEEFADGDGATGSSGALAPEGTVVAPDTATGDREIIATASAAVRVDDVEAAATQVGELAAGAGGYVEALSLGADGPAYPHGMSDAGPTVPYPQSNAWVAVRVPAAELDATIAALSDLGEVTSSQLDRRDVTGEAVDLRARIDALQTSVVRLEALMADATSTADLLAAEGALSERQAQLESYEQQLKHLEDQVGMSSLTVSLHEPGEVVEADPAGFGDGIAAGWNGLVATLNGIVIALGFMLPWLGVIAVVVLVVWLIRRAARRRARARTDAAAAPSAEEGDTPAAGAGPA